MPPEINNENKDADLLLVGGGLAAGLIAWRLRALRPDVRLLVLEQGDTLGGNHTWSFHPTDISERQRRWLDPLIEHRWNAHDVRFPNGCRRLAGAYASVTSARFARVVGDSLGDRLRTRTTVQHVRPDHVALADGSVLRAGAVIDARGVRVSPHLNLGFQKFLGQEVRLRAPHRLSAPVLMDATVAQQDGYRFVYVLPFTRDTVLIEDTCYSDGAQVEAERLRANIGAYAQAQGWSIAEVLREERGVLPILLGGDAQAFWNDAGGVAQAGLSAGLFHPTTGYSLPDAVALADLVAGLPDLSAAALFKAVRDHALARWRARRFFLLLNRMLFKAAEPSSRWRVMQRFYTLPEGLITRFYEGRLTLLDKARLVTGKPPVPFLAGVRAAFDPRIARPRAHSR